jgi:hypothetical protein
MPITIDGTGTISGISAGGLPDSSITNADLATDAVSTSKILNGAVTTAKMGSAEQSGLCKAFVNFNGTGTVAIRASYNVSSITDNGTGDYTVNFTTALADANFVVVNTGGDTGAGTGGRNYNTSIAAKTTTTAEIISGLTSTGAAVDCPAIDVAVFR